MRYLVPILFSCLLVSSNGGCRSGGGRAASDTAADRPLTRETQKATLAFHAGYDEEALQRYRLALARAWELDDPAAIATAAFNLAAASAATDDFVRARQALAEARAELSRAASGSHDQVGHSLALADVWMLEAKVARAEGRLDEAAYYANCLAGPAIACAPECQPAGCCATRWRCWCAGWQRCREYLAGCRDSEEPPPAGCDQATIALALLRAQLALDIGDIPQAQTELACLRQSDAGNGDPGTQAEIAAVRARLALQREQPIEAAQWLDQEAFWLRQSEHWREIPRATSAAAEAFLIAGMLPEASDRFHRTARILYGRGDLLAALHFLEQSVALSLPLEDADLQGRAELLLDEIESANHQRSSSERITADEFAEFTGWPTDAAVQLTAQPPLEEPADETD